jgi:hypothetical protein
VKSAFWALVIGYVIGAKTGGKELDNLSRSLMTLFGTDEFADVVTSARSQVGSTLRELAAMVDGQPDDEEAGDLIARVRNLVSPA